VKPRNKGAVGAALDRRHWDDGLVLQRVHQQTDVDELAGKSLPSLLSNMARSFTVPVVGSISLSMVASLPVAIWTVWLRS